VSLFEQELLTFPEHMSSLAGFSEVRVAQSSVFYVLFCRSLCVLFSIGQCIVCLGFILGKDFEIMRYD